MRARKREGDGASPRGRFSLLTVLYRPDRVPRPRTSLPVRMLSRRDGWCDTAGDRNYNRPVYLPYGASHEELWRADRLYDIVVVVDYNVRRRGRNLGSAIFMHVADPAYGPTAGCVALELAHLQQVLARVPRRAVIEIGRHDRVSSRWR
jgi:L,D-peptidoglycan transpeptidase YkuD (ErfK/YbiS/YcfS/YnhG family)